MQLHQGDAADYILKVVSEVHEGRADPVDMVFVDAFDANDDVPASLWSPGEALATNLSHTCMHRFGSCWFDMWSRVVEHELSSDLLTKSNAVA